MMRSRNIYLVGPLGAGKSTIGRYLAGELKAEFYDTDQVIEESCGAEITWIFDIEGEDGFRKREEKAIYDLTEKSGIVLATGGGAIESPENRTRLAARGTVIYLQTTLEQQLSRTEKDKKRPLLQVKQEEKRGVIENLNMTRKPLYEEVADYTLDTHDKSVRAIANEIIQFVMEEETL